MDSDTRPCRKQKMTCNTESSSAAENLRKAICKVRVPPDVVIRTSDGQEFAAHWLLLTSQCQFFDTMYEDLKSGPSACVGVDVLPLEEPSEVVIPALAFIYKLGNIDIAWEVDETNVKCLICFAHKYEMAACLKSCEEFLVDDLKLSSSNSTEWVAFATGNRYLDRFLRRCERHIANKLNKVPLSNEALLRSFDAASIMRILEAKVHHFTSINKFWHEVFAHLADKADAMVDHGIFEDHSWHDLREVMQEAIDKVLPRFKKNQKSPHPEANMLLPPDFKPSLP